MIGETLGHYKVLEQLGRGGMGEVYLAEDLSLGRKVALKFLPEAFTGDPERMARFEREAKLLASLNHPNIAAIYGLEQADGKRFLVLEYVEGETLQARLSKGALPVEDALGVCRQVAEGLEAAHEKGVIHRDLKPANVMITAEEKVKILDFGLAKALADEIQSVESSHSPTITEAMTQPGVVLGTAAYMSPEQAKGKSVDKRADIWAFGCILYECLTARRVFQGETVTETLAAVLTEEPEWYKVPARVNRVLRRCLEKDPKRRLRDIGDAMPLLEVLPISMPASRGRLRPAWIIAILFFLTSLSLAFILFRQKSSAVADLMKFQIELPDKVTISPNSLLSLSPDGEKLAFATLDPDGNQRLWLRPLDSLEAQPLAGTESNWIPPFFWSPDSRFIAFDAGGKLKKMDIASGSIQTICDLSGIAVGGSWNRDGVILFSDYNASNGIMQVSASGGNASPVTKPNLKRQEIRHNLPMFLPDGRHFIYHCQSAIPENAGIYIGSLDANPEEQEINQLLATSSAARYMPPVDSIPGQLLFLREQTLMAQPFDGKRLEKIGESISVIDNVGHYLDSGFFTASGGGVLVFKSGLGDPISQPTWFDRQGKDRGVVGKPGLYFRLAISPDGGHAAASRITAPTRSTDIWILDLLRGTERRLTHGPGDSNRPIWSPDGTHLIFQSNREGVQNLYQKAVSGIEQEKLILKSSDHKYPTSWSSDGRFVLYTVVKQNTRSDLYVLSLENEFKEMPILNTDFNEGDGQFSPNMRWIAYVSDESGRYQVYVRPFSQIFGETLSSTGGISVVSKGSGIGPRWSSDGKELFYQALDGTFMAVAVRGDTTFQAGEPRILFKGDPDLATMSSSLLPLSTYDVSEDGNLLLLPSAPAKGSSEPFNVILNWTSLLEK